MKEKKKKTEMVNKNNDYYIKIVIEIKYMYQKIKQHIKYTGAFSKP